jgi:hypothetical protein
MWQALLVIFYLKAFYSLVSSQSPRDTQPLSPTGYLSFVYLDPLSTHRADNPSVCFLLQYFLCYWETINDLRDQRDKH